MCGINGYFYNNNSTNVHNSLTRQIESNLKKLKLRGPNSQGIYHGKTYSLAHTRLAIQDVKHGQQPLIHPESQTVITYNGEIYNHKTIRKELEKLNYKFETNCDTEVLLKAYIEWGASCLDKFNGCFAFVIADQTKNQFFMARDRMGIKPLYYSDQPDFTCFSSTVKAIVNYLPKLEPSLEAISHYLTSARTTLAEQTLVKNVKSLLPGHYRIYDMNKPTEETVCYWKKPYLKPEEKSTLSFNEASEQVKELLEDAVKIRLISDVPLASFLSGGLDSSIIASNLCKHSTNPPKMYCAGTSEEEFNEIEFAAEMAEKLDIDLHYEKIDNAAFFETWQFLIDSKGLPLSTPNEISIFHLAKALSKDYTVALTGEGADEIFAGYIQPQYGYYDYERAAKSPDDTAPNPVLSWPLQRRYGRSYFFNEADHFFSSCSWTAPAVKSQLFKEEIWQELDEDDAVFTHYEDYFEKLKHCSPLDQRLHLHSEINLEGLLNRVDSSTMAASIEARVPFNDHRLVELAFSLPDEFKYKFRSQEAEERAKDLLIDEIDQEDLLESKRLLRQAFSKEIPQSILNRKKMSFPVPFTQWLDTPLAKKMIQKNFQSPLCQQLFNEKELNKLLQRSDRNLWLINNLSLWWEALLIDHKS